MGTELLLLLIGLAFGAETIEEAALVAVLDDRQPVVQVARAELARAAGARLGAAGAFDLKLKGKADSAVAGYYDWSAVEIAAEQQIPGWGARVGAGYRASEGALPVYYAERETAVQGEVFASLSVPLLRDGFTDAGRAAITMAEADLGGAAARARALQVQLQREALAAYWGWVAAVAKLGVAEEQAALAVARDAAVRARVSQGDLPPVAVTDNQRALFERQAEVAAQRQKVQQSAAKLSVYWRGPDGAPRSPGVDEAPARPAPPDGAARATALMERLPSLLAARPEITEIDALIEQLDAELRLARAQRLPGLDVVGSAARGFGGDDKALTQPELVLGLRLDAPAQQRKARGKLDELEAKRLSVQQKRRLMLDKAAAEAQGAFAAVEGTAAAWALARQGAEAAEALAVAERRRFEAGDTDLLTVYLREQAAGKAAGEVAEALSAWHVALADLDAALAITAAAPLQP
jgi:outer membrane protein TolC